MKAFRLVSYATSSMCRAPYASCLRLAKRCYSAPNVMHQQSNKCESTVQAEVLSNDAKHFCEQGHFGSMVDNLQAAIKLAPTNRAYYSALANGLIRMNKIEEAGQVLQKRAQLAENEHAGLLFESGMRKREEGDMKDAMQCLDGALQLQPDNSLFLQERSMLHFKLSSFADGVKDYVDAIAVEKSKK